MATIEFWYEFASTYSYPAAMRIEEVAGKKAVQVKWRPFLLGPIFASQGWRDSPFNIYAAKGAYMWRDMERICTAQGLPFQHPAIFPVRSLLAARLALCPLLEGRRGAFSKNLYTAQFADNRDISQTQTLKSVLVGLGIDADLALAQANSDNVKAGLRANTETAIARGIFGAPSFVTPDGELFWGNDRLEQAVAWAAA